MSDPRTYDDKGDVIGGYLTPDEARERGVEWHGRPNEPTPYSTPDEARGLNIPWRPASEFPDYNYNNAYAATATQAPRARGSNPIEQLMAHVAKMNQTPGGWQSGKYALSTPQKQQMFPSLPSYWPTAQNYSNIPLTTPDEITYGRGATNTPRPSGGVGVPAPTGSVDILVSPWTGESIPRPPKPWWAGPDWIIQWNPWTRQPMWTHPNERM